MKNLISKKLVLLVVSLVLVVSLAVGGTLMYIIDDTEAVTNNFGATEVTCLINETFDGSTKKDVTVTNTSDIEAYLRATIIVNWVQVDANGNVTGILGTPVQNSDYTIEAEENSKWVYDTASCYYYYTDPVAAGATTDELIKTIGLAPGVTAPAGYHLSVTILADAIQADPVAAREAAGWVIK